ncbi:MAG: hypothetical protein WCL38_00070 [Actinomycetota bacterium]
MTEHSGVIATFDGATGLGTVVADQKAFPFHATAIEDGTRQIALGETVTFEIHFAAGGRVEAGRIRPSIG